MTSLSPYEVDGRCSHLRCRDADSYVMSGECCNCGWFGEVRHTKGHQADPKDCPQCGCRTVRPGEFKREVSP